MTAARRLAVIVCLLLFANAPTGARPAPAEPLCTLDFQEAEVAGVARAMERITGRAIFVDPRVKGRMALYTDRAVTAAQAWRLFLGALRGLGYAAVETGSLVRIVPEADAKLQAAVAGPGGASAPGDAVLTQVFHLVHAGAADLLPVLRPLITPNNTINLVAGVNALVVTDYADNLARIGRLVEALDTPASSGVEVIPVAHGLASELAATLLKLLDDKPAAGTPALSIVADPRLNALLVRAPNAVRLADVRTLAAQLDRAPGGGAGGGRIHVIYLKHAEATRLATVLRAAAGGDGAKGAASSGGSTSTSLAASTTNVATAAAGSASASAATTPLATTAAPSTGGWIQADPASNALVITAPQSQFEELRAVVELLDARRAQVYVESLVVEVDASRAIDIGVQWKSIFGISESSLPTLTLGDIASALQSVSGTNVLSTANVVTLDNEEARIVVGQNVPFVTGSYTTSGNSSSNPFQTVERKDVGITLRIRPQIGPAGSIRMAIQQESSSVSSTVTPGTSNVGPTTNKRSIESTVVVDDGHIIALGGLIEDSYESEAGQVPGLADIPLLGGLFRYFTRTRRKTNLLVFLRPHVMPDQAASDALTMDRYDAIRAKQLAHPLDVRQVLPVPDMPALP